MHNNTPHITCTRDAAHKKILVTLSGCFCRFDDQNQKQALHQMVTDNPHDTIIVHSDHLESWDSSLVIVLTSLIQTAQQQKVKLDLSRLPKDLNALLTLVFAVNRHPPTAKIIQSDFLTRLGKAGINCYQSTRQGLNFITDTLVSFGRMMTGRVVSRPIDFWFALEDSGPKAVGIVALISFMVGLILAFVGAIQLQTFGAQIYVASLVTIAMTRIMGAIMCGVIMAGRTGASYAAAIGTMQVNEELDALKTMGIPITDFLVLPRFVALIVTMPLLTLLADFAGMLGGAFVGISMLDITPQEYLKYSVNAFNITNFLVGIFHGFVFGIVIALCGCYYGATAGRTADSVGVAATKAVVSAIVWMIVLTGIITVIFKVIGI